MSACCKGERELIIRFVQSCGKAGSRTGYQGSEELDLSKVRSRENKGKQGRHAPGERERKSGRGSVEMKRREGAWREREILTHGRIRSRMQWRKNEKNSFTGAGQRHLQSF